MQLDVEESTPASDMTLLISPIVNDPYYKVCLICWLWPTMDPLVAAGLKDVMLTGQFFLECSDLTSLVSLYFAWKNLQLLIIYFSKRKKHVDWTIFFKSVVT